MTAPTAPQPSPGPLVAPRRRSPGGNLALVLALAVATGGVGYAIGHVTAPATPGGQAGFAGQPGQPGQAPGGSFAPTASGAPGAIPGGGSMSLDGTVSAIAGTTLTLTTSAGRTITVDVSGATFHAQAAATAADVVTGATVRLDVTGVGGPGGPGGAVSSPSAGAATSTISATDVTIVTR